MCSLRVAAFVAAVLGLPTLGFAQAQTTIYICTPDGQVIRQLVDASGTIGTNLLYTGNRNEAFTDCVVGPDGWLYIASGASVIRINPATPPRSGSATTLSLVGSTAQSLAFNVSTLYIMTATTGLYTLTGTPGLTDPLDFPDPATALMSVGAGAGHGLAFDVFGNLVVTAGGTLQRALVNLTAPFYTNAPSILLTRTATLFGAAVNTCGEIVYADKASRTLRVRAKDGSAHRTLTSFPNTADYPVALEIDSSNNTYVMTAQSDAGASAKLWRIGGNLTNSCAAGNAALILDLSTLLSGMNKLKGLSSARALGVAVGPTDVSMTRNFTTAACHQLFDFGYHTASLSFSGCSSPFSVTIHALKTKPSDVVFSGVLGSEHTPVRYSPMGGHAVQYVFTGGPAAPFTFASELGFYAQEVLARPGIARASGHAPADPYTESVMTDFWDVGIHDAAAGTRGDDFSKRIVFNSPAPPAQADCRIEPASWEEPFLTQTPLFKRNQVVKVAFTARTSTGEPCGGGGTMHVSVARVSPPPVTLFAAQSAGNAQTGNVMSNEGDKYWFNLDTQPLGIGEFVVTVWGTTLPPTTRTFTIGQ